MEAHERIVKVRTANDDYHEAAEGVMQCEELEGLCPEGVNATEVKANFIALAQEIFELMKRADEVIAKYYDPPEEP